MIFRVNKYHIPGFVKYCADRDCNQREIRQPHICASQLKADWGSCDWKKSATTAYICQIRQCAVTRSCNLCCPGINIISKKKRTSCCEAKSIPMYNLCSNRYTWTFTWNRGIAKILPSQYIKPELQLTTQAIFPLSCDALQKLETGLGLRRIFKAAWWTCTRDRSIWRHNLSTKVPRLGRFSYR